MNGKARVQAQIASGVRELVEDIDFLRLKYGVNHINVLTPRAETRIRSGLVANIPFKLQFDILYYHLTITYGIGYPRSCPMIIEIGMADDCKTYSTINLESFICNLKD